LREHETVEGVLIRMLGMPYGAAHAIATIAEKRAVERAGHRFDLYQEALEPLIHADEREIGTRAPADILLLPYLGTRWWDKVRGGRRLGKGDTHYQGRPHERQRCRDCAMWQAPGSCDLVSGGILFTGWCQYWEERQNTGTKPTTDKAKRIDRHAV
jgi:hypothetical protein